MSKAIVITNHARTRQAQRNLSDDEVRFVLDHGREIRCAGVLHVFLGKRDLPNDQVRRRRYQHLEGTVLVLDDQHEETVLITVYRNRNGLKDIRSKTKYNTHKQMSISSGHTYRQQNLLK